MIRQFPQKMNVFVVGAGVMGAGITQVVAQAGHSVHLYDEQQEVAGAALESLSRALQSRVDRKKLEAHQAAEILTRIQLAQNLADADQAHLVIEAIVEDMNVKISLFETLETIVSRDCVLATNTSSLSVTALGRTLEHPERLIGMHFFNPAPVMKLVEVICGVQTSPKIAEQVYQLAESLGKVPVHAKSTPGFIVNRIARPFYAEALALLHERMVEPARLDSLMRAAGFRMGPCELMDLIGHDTNYKVTSSLFEANFYDRRYMPSVVQRSLLDAGFFGRKSGRGFYDYLNPRPLADPEPTAAAQLPDWQNLTVHGNNRISDHFAARLDELGVTYQKNPASSWVGLDSDGRQLRLSSGQSASQLGTLVAVFDLPLELSGTRQLAMAVSRQTPREFKSCALDWLRLFGFNPLPVADTPGLIVARTIAMLINEAADAVQQGVCSEQDANLATRAGLNFPAGPFEWLDELGVDYVVRMLENLDRVYRGERYRVSPWLLQRKNVPESQTESTR